MWRRSSVVLLVLIAVSLVPISQPVQAAVPYTTFDGYAGGTPAAALTVPGVSFSGANWVIAGIIPVNYLASPVLGIAVTPGPLTMTFDRPQGQVSFSWITVDTAPLNPTPVNSLIAETYLNDVLVSTQTLVATTAPASCNIPATMTCYEAQSQIIGEFDRVVLTFPGANQAAIDNLSSADVGFGCDQLPIPATAVGATFVADTPLLWMPDAGAVSDVTLAAGKSVRVTGVDTTGQFYQVIFACSYLWAPVNTLSPNFDAVWNGAPLPTGVVQ